MASLPLLLLLAVVLLLWLHRRRQRRLRAPALRLPPSPWPLPLLGHLLHLARDLPHRALRDLAQRHGPLLLLRLGGLPIVVASSADAAHELMVSHDVDFASRYLSRMARLSIQPGAEGIFFAPYGAQWRQLRKICTVELLSARRVLSFRPTRQEEAARLLRAVAASRAMVNLSGLLAAYAADSSVRTIIGSRFKDRDGFLELVSTGSKLFAGMSLPDLYPSSRLAMLLSRTPPRVRQHRKELDAFMDTVVREHQENRRADDDDDEDLLDVLLRIQRKGDLQFPLSTEMIKSVVQDIFARGSETAATTLQWAMSELVRSPRVMRKVQDEAQLALAGQTTVTESSLADLKYMRLVVKEVLRLHPPAPLLLPRECRSDGCQVLGYDVPKGTMVLVNAWAICRDPTHWDAAEEFMPERFERGDAADFKGADMEYTPFGAGRRMCPGMSFGLANVELALAGLLYHFDWELPGGAEAGELDMAEEMGVTVRRRNDLVLVPVVRVPVPLN
ncbi:zealexin A1 synthase-like [Triticum dicoccoides]|uniref:zealexin A1 synthase-like n=1 Tax=Triticum dicoccoides TaxID=85692 RepID=UPI0018914941|nr:zealexin A1 synthase-like [Triticum dicoccoides]